MKRQYILLTLLLTMLMSLAARTGYQPLVREGVRWICFDYNLMTIGECQAIYNIYSYEFAGDTIISDGQGSFLYKKLFEKFLYTITDDYETDQVLIEYNHQNDSNLRALMRESHNQVFEYDRVYSQDNAEGHCLYDFSHNDTAYVSSTWETEMIPLEYSGLVEIQGLNCKKFKEPTPMYERTEITVVEGVGYDGTYGDLINPNPSGILPTCICDFGLVCLEDKEGKILFKGLGYENYMKLMTRRADLSGDGRVDVSDLSAAIDAAVGRAENEKADINGDGRVDIADVNTVVNVILNARQ